VDRGTDTLKAVLREKARTARQGILAEERAPLAASAARRAFALPEVTRARYVLGFAAAPEELDPEPLLEALRQAGATVCLPRISGPGTLALHVCELSTPLHEGPFGLRQPPSHTPTAEPGSIDLVIVPGVAFDASGNRLGFGGGYYDRLLAGMPRTMRIALAFEGQILDAIPSEAHDERVDIIVTPDRVLRSPHSR
jgi:5-formyltetrahydrofolate cyclo-ligase